eukprot:2586621-Pyramimonas_sp.AAC.1
MVSIKSVHTSLGRISLCLRVLAISSSPADATCSGTTSSNCHNRSSICSGPITPIIISLSIFAMIDLDGADRISKGGGGLPLFSSRSSESPPRGGRGAPFSITIASLVVAPVPCFSTRADVGFGGTPRGGRGGAGGPARAAFEVPADEGPA